jgi:ABC-type multidrug transport system fused ATPase/permease subunit
MMKMTTLDCATSTAYPVVILTMIVGYCSAMLFAIIMPDALSAFIGFGAFSWLMIAMSGYPVTESSVLPWLQWLVRISYARWSVGMIFSCTFNDLFYTGDILVWFFEYDDVSLSETVETLLLYVLIAEGLILLAMVPWPSFLRQYATIRDVPFAIESDGDSVAVDDGISVQMSTISSPLQEHTRDRQLTVENGTVSTAVVNRPSVVEVMTVAAKTTFGIMPRVSMPINSIRPSESSRKTYAENSGAFKVSRRLQDQARRALAFSQLSYTLPAKSGKAPLCLLQGVSGHVKSGELCALMGPSGAGKTRLFVLMYALSTMRFLLMVALCR